MFRNSLVAALCGVLGCKGSGAPVTAPDTNAPVVTKLELPATSASLDVALTLAAADDVGVTGYFLSEDGSLPASIAWVATAPASFTFAAAGARTLHAWARDAAGNVSTPASASTTITLADTTPPTMSLGLPATATSLTVAVTPSASDDVAVAGYFLSEDGTLPVSAGWVASAPADFTFAGAGARTLYGWARDAAGNVSTRASATTTITVSDTTPPTISAFTLPSIAPKLSVPLTLTSSDDVGVTGWYLNETGTLPGSPAWLGAAPASYAFSTPGAHTLYAWVRDAAGNVSTRASATTTVNIQWVQAYYVGYQVGMYPVASIDWSSMTHIIVGAVAVNSNGTFDTTFFQSSNSAGATFAQNLATTAHANGVKAILMLGGAGHSANFKTQLTAGASTFAASLLGLMSTLGYDGLDLDIESSDFTIDDYVTLASALRSASSSAILTVAGSSIEMGQSVDPKVVTLAGYVDRYNTQSYQGGTNGLFTGTDYTGTTYFKSWFYTAVSGATDLTPYALDHSLGALAAAGIPKSKLGLGIAFYAGCYLIPATTPPGGSDVSAPLMPAYATSSYCWNCGIGGGDNSYPLSTFFDAGGVYAAHLSAKQRDATAQVPYLSLATAVNDTHCGGNTRYLIYDDETSIEAKGAWSKSNGYGGVIVWTIQQGWLTATAAEGRAQNSLMQALRTGFLLP